MQRWLSPQVGFGLVAALYVLSFPYHPKLRSPNELCRMAQSRALIDDHTLNINGVLQRQGMVGDLSCTALVRDGEGERLLPCVGPDAPRANVVAFNYYPSKAPLVSFLGAPVYAVLKALLGNVTELMQVLFSRLFVTVLPSLAMLVLLRKFLLAYVKPETADVLTVVYALGTMAFSYAEAFMSHQLTAVLLFTAFFCAWKVERGEWSERGWLLAGLSAGAAVVCEYTSALAVVSVASWVLVRRWKQWVPLARAVGLVAVGAAPMLGFLLWYHAATFGSPFASGYKFLNDANYMHWHQGGFLGIKVPDLRALGLSYFSPLRGLFALSPFLIVALGGLRDLRSKERSLFTFTLVLLALHTYFTSSFSYESWGWTVGPRHLTGMVPFLMLPVGLVFERLRATPAASVKLGLVAGLMASSVLATGLVGFVNYVPDDVSTSVFGLALPVWFDGFWPVSVLAVFIANPLSGVVLVACLAAAVAWVVSASGKGFASQAWVGVAVALALHFGALRLFTRYDAGDTGATKFLESVWVAPSGQTLELRAR
ncbi:MAG: hypothetical protein U0228_36155 [Myxococcaceae bacterium]